MIPIGDMINHRMYTNVDCKYSEEKKGFCITALSSISKGGEIHDCYGPTLNNTTFFATYGFI